MRILARSFIVVMLVGVALSSSARADNRAAAREAYQDGTRNFEIGDYQAALAAFKKAYLAYDDPAFLFNMAQCYRLLNDKPEAVRTYRVYLNKVPNAPNRADVEQIIAALESAIAQEHKASSMPPTGSEAPGSAVKPPAIGTVPPPAAKPPAAVTPPVAATPAPAPAPSREHPLLKKWWFWTAIGGGVLVIAAVATGIAVGASASHPDFKPTFPDVGPASMALSLRF